MDDVRLNSLLPPLVACLLLVACGGGDAPSGQGPIGGTTPPPGSGSMPPPDPVPPTDNSPPGIRGTPPGAATVGQTWSFQPAISDPDGDALTVAAQNLPPWVALEPTTGYMEGAPADADVRTWSNILVEVSDGQATASLASFSIVVSASASGSATLSWNPPTTRADGSPLSELAGYRILYGQKPGEYDTEVPLNNPGATSYVIEGLGTGTWYFTLKSVTSDGLVSVPSEEVSKAL